MELKYYINDRPVSRWRFRRSLRKQGYSKKMIKRLEGYLYISKQYYKDDVIYTVGD